MPDLPVMLRLAQRRVLVVGGGAVAHRRCRSLLECGAEVLVVAPRIDPRLRALGVELAERAFRDADVSGAVLVVAATDDAGVNAAVAAAAGRAGALVNRTDDPAAGDLTVAAHGRLGPITVAVDTGNSSAATASRLRDELLEHIDPDLPVLLEAVALWRAKLKDTVPDAAARAERLRRMAGATALGILRDSGLEALDRHLAAIASGRPAPDCSSAPDA